MLEAIGERPVRDLLRDDRPPARAGRPRGVQTILVPDERWERYRRTPDWIERYVFPGCLIPSLEALDARGCGAARGSAIYGVDEIGEHYAETLRRWRASFHEHLDEVRALGYDQRFERTWDFYLAFCEAAFRTRALRDVQLTLTRAFNERLPVTRWELLLLGWGVALALLAVLYASSCRTRDATAVDAGWGGALALCAVLYAVLGPGELAQRLLIAIPVAVENVRIASLVRKRLGKGEDSRYRELRRRWRERGREQPTFAIFYQAQALARRAALDPGAARRASTATAPSPPCSGSGLALWVVAVVARGDCRPPARRLPRRPGQRGRRDATAASGATRATRTTSSRR